MSAGPSTSTYAGRSALDRAARPAARRPGCGAGRRRTWPADSARQQVAGLRAAPASARRRLRGDLLLEVAAQPGQVVRVVLGRGAGEALDEVRGRARSRRAGTSRARRPRAPPTPPRRCSSRWTAGPSRRRRGLAGAQLAERGDQHLQHVAPRRGASTPDRRSSAAASASTSASSVSKSAIGNTVSKLNRRFSAALISLTPRSRVLAVAMTLKPSRGEHHRRPGRSARGSRAPGRTAATAGSPAPPAGSG